MKSSYTQDDVLLLLKDITGLVEPQSTEERERLIQSGRHYCEMLPIEYVPTQKYMDIYHNSLKSFAKPTADAVGCLAEKVLQRRGENTVLVSLARAGIPIGILLKRYLRYRYHITVPHYAISIIRGRGIDKNAMKYLLDRHAPQDLLFVDGWVGKGAILNQLQKAVSEFDGVSPEIAVVADPANVTELCGTHEDILIPSSCLNCTVSGLISRTFLRDDIIGENDFHGAVYYGELAQQDLSYQFIDAIERFFTPTPQAADITLNGSGMEEVRAIAEHFGIADINLIKPGIGETTRVLLRRVPWQILVNPNDRNAPELSPILRLAEEKNVPVTAYPLTHYRCCGIIRALADT
ncbi:MAG: cysteine protease StiP family protein [Clostridia bacterium]|nr:cysteine protease StiP family protein [Clostridia bacterium]